MKVTKDITFKHQCNAGDLIASMSGIKHLCEERKAKAIIYQRLDAPQSYYEGAIHPIKNDSGNTVGMNRKMFELIKPLILSQSYVKDFKIWQGESVYIDLDKIREVFVNIPNGNIQKWYFYLYPQMACDISKEWIDVFYSPNFSEIDFKNKIIINRTQRYTNTNITYFFLKKYQKQILFTGIEEEYQLFRTEFNLDVERLEVNNFLELAQALKNCKFFLGNQSFVYNLAEAMKIPRIVEYCSFAPNCTTHGKDGYEFLYNAGLEFHFNQLNK